MEEYNDPLRKFKEIMEEDQKTEERLIKERKKDGRNKADGRRDV